MLGMFRLRNNRLGSLQDATGTSASLVNPEPKPGVEQVVILVFVVG